MKQNNKRSLSRRLVALLKPYHGKMGAALICMVGAGICAAIPAWLMKNVVDGVLIRKEYFLSLIHI